MERKESKPRRQRRTKKALEEALWDTLEKQIKRKGFQNITILGLAKEAGFEPPVIYNRFKNLDEILDQYVRKYDYWFKDAIMIDKNKNPKENFKKMLTNLTEEVYNNEIMQKLLLWELADENEISRRVSRNREEYSKSLIQYFTDGLKNTEMQEFEPASALMIAGIYYLILHKKSSTFCNIDFDTEEGKQRLIKTVEEVTDKIFADKSDPIERKTRKEIAKKMLAKGIDKNAVQELTSLSITEIDEL